MKSIAIIALCVASALWAQAPAEIPPDTVVATADEKPITAGELMWIFRMSPPEAQKNFVKDPKMFVESFALIRKLAELAEKAHLDQQTPLKEQIEVSRRQFMASAAAAAARDSITISAAEHRKFYDDHIDRYQQAKVSVLLVSFRANTDIQAKPDPKAKKVLTEAEAEAKIKKLRAQLRSGADFVKLVKEHSDDADSVARDGDFGPLIKRSDSNMPENVMGAIFKLKPKEISEPLRTPTGFYLFRLDELKTQPFDKVRDDIFIEIQQKRFDEWREQLTKSLNLKIVKDLFAPSSGGAPK